MASIQAPLAGRYRFSRRVQAGTRTIAWLAIDERTGKDVVASPLTAARFAGLLRALGVEHAHLAPIVDLIKDPDPASLPVTDTTARIAGVGIAAYIPGRTLHEELKSGALEPQDAVTAMLHVAEAVAELHQGGAIHGAVSPRSIVIAPASERLSPILTQLIAPTSGAYSAPERLRGQGPSVEDDVWALYATLHASLVAGVPFSGTTREELVDNMLAGKLHRLSEFNIDDAELENLLVAGLTATRSQRQMDAKRVCELLDGWLVDRGYSERDSVVSARQDLIQAPTEPPVAVYEDDEDMTRVYVRSSGDLMSGVLWPNVEGGTPSDASASSEPFAPAAPLKSLEPAVPISGFPNRNPGRPRLQSIHLDPFTGTGFTEPQAEELAPSGELPAEAAEIESSAAPRPAPSETEPATLSSEEVRELAESKRPSGKVPAAGGGQTAQTPAARLTWSTILKLAILAVLIGTSIAMCAILTK